MRGLSPTIRDIVIREQPCPVDLHCEEHLEEEEEERQVNADFFQVEVKCPLCNSCLKFCVLASNESVRGLYDLLLEDLQILCLPCYRRQRNGV